MGPAAAEANVSAAPTSHDFGLVTVGSSSVRTVTVTATCGLSFMGGCIDGSTYHPAPVISGPNASEFSQTNDCGSSFSGGVPTSRSCTYTITLAPTGVGAKTATLALGTGSYFPHPSPQPVSPVQLAGTGTAPPAAGAVAGQVAKKCKRAKKKGASSAKKKCKKKK